MDADAGYRRLADRPALVVVASGDDNTEAKPAPRAPNPVAGGGRRKLEAISLALREQVPPAAPSAQRLWRAGPLPNPPDNIFLLTDGLPTQENARRGWPGQRHERLRHFREAIRRLPLGVPVNTILSRWRATFARPGPGKVAPLGSFILTDWPEFAKAAHAPAEFSPSSG